ncbi:hemerythrin domain-containing protein [Dactylosporangium darangshiense]|uniref:Hemerythrin-like domain-containing protein n=1 Tax=Dactylosporangium darangshiense TaxID=579108 RepID=A0ABP8D9Y2_9ACTN
MPADLIHLLVAEHRRLESLFADVETAQAADRRRAALTAALHALALHAAREERFLHPALREHLPAGPEIAEFDRAEHAAMARDAAGCDEAGASALFDVVRLHMQQEETELFPRLAQACPPQLLQRLGELLESARVTE